MPRPVPSQRPPRVLQIPSFERPSGSATLFNRPRDWQAFERLARDLFARITGDVHIDLHGRNGQPQGGVDIVGIDQRTRARIGIQCRGRGDGSTWSRTRLTPAELREEVAKARGFYPKLDVFVLLTTGPNDVVLKKAAAAFNRPRGGAAIRVEVHGWDWIEGRLAEHFDLAVQYGLIAVVQAMPGNSQRPSKIAQQIGTRFVAALDMMNAGRASNDRFTLQGIAKHVGFPDWHLLEEIAEGRSKANLADLAAIANGLGLNESWLVEGKESPFSVDPQDYAGADEQYASILRLNPREIVFVRRELKDFESIVVAQIDEFKWIAFRWDHPMSSHVGGTGRRQLFEYCCLMRRLYRTLDFAGGIPLLGRHISSADFMRLLAGDIYPGTLLGRGHNDDWWMDFAELAEDRVEGRSTRSKELREAIYIARTVLSEFQARASKNGWMRDTLIEAGFPVHEVAPASVYRIEAGLKRN